MRILTSRAIATTAAAAIALSTLGLAPASAHGPQYGNNDAAAAAAMVAMFGTMAALIASSRHRRAHYHYGYGPQHYQPGPYYYRGYAGDDGVYASRHHWRHHFHR